MVDDLGKAGGYALFVEPPLVEYALVQGAPILARQERRTAKDQCEHFQIMAALTRRQIESQHEINLAELLSDGTRPRVIEPPSCPISEYAPAQFALGQVVCPAQVAEHLGRRRGLVRVAAVEWQVPSLGFDDGEAVFVPLPFLGEAVSPILGRSVRKQQPVRYVFAPLGAQVLLPQALGPAEQAQNRPD